MSGGSAGICCAFCGRSRGEVAWLFCNRASGRVGRGAAICDDCIAGLAAALEPAPAEAGGAADAGNVAGNGREDGECLGTMR